MTKELMNSWHGGNGKNVDLTNLKIDGYKLEKNCTVFSGKRYEEFFKPLTEFSLYKILTNEDVIKSSKILKKHIENIKRNNTQLINFELSEIENFQKMIEIYGNNGFSLYSWY